MAEDKMKKQELEELEKLANTPIQNSQHYQKIKNLDIYLYPKIKLEDLNDLEKSQLRVIMVVGQTGAGKSTLLDAMVNFIAGVKFNSSFRYKLIDEKGIIETKKYQTTSITDNVNQYLIKPQGTSSINFPVLLVDTPGFMDTRGIKRDEKITSDIQKYFKEKVDMIHCVCLVSISSNARLTHTQKYVFNKVLEIFGKDIEQNIANLFTFCDGGIPQLLASIKEEGIPSNYYYKFNNSALFCRTGDAFEKMYWDMSMESMKMFFKAVQENFTGKSLRLTKQVLEERKKLELTIVSIRPRIDQGIQQMEAERKELKFLKGYKDDIEKNKNFQYTYKEEKFRKVEIPPGVYNTTCLNCNRTCHENCDIFDDNDKSRCSAITDGYCTVCPNKCYWTQHFNLPFKYEYYYVEELRYYEDLKKRYYEAQNSKNISDQVLDGLAKDFKQVQQKIYNDIETMCSSLKKLDEIALKPNPYSSTEIIDLMIQQEQSNKQVGYLDRIQGLNDVKQKYQLIQKLTTSNEKEKALKEFFSSYQNTISELDNINKGKDNSQCSIFDYGFQKQQSNQTKSFMFLKNLI